MNFLQHKEKKFICFTLEEIDSLFKKMMLFQLIKLMKENSLSFDDLSKNPQKMIELSGQASKKYSEGKSEHEIFVAYYIISEFYGENPDICFELKEKFNSKNIKISSLNDLKTCIKESTLVDFAILSKKEFRQFQLKRYLGEATTEKLLRFLKEKLLHYGNDLGHVNLLVILSKGGDLSQVNFKLLHEELKKLNIDEKGGWIMLSFNENNKFSVINQIFPGFSRTEIPFKLNYPNLIEDYKKNSK